MDINKLLEIVEGLSRNIDKAVKDYNELAAEYITLLEENIILRGSLEKLQNTVHDFTIQNKVLYEQAAFAGSAHDNIAIMETWTG